LRLRLTAATLRGTMSPVLPVVLIGPFLVVLDFFIVNVAIPSLQSDLAASTGAIQWVVAGYGLTFATGMITAGRLGDRFGRRRMFVLGLALFTVASLACGLAPTATALVIARLAQGAAAALLTPQVLAIMGVVYSGADRVRALSVYGITLGLAAVGGQLIGGVLVEADVAGLGWRAVFLINLPIGLVGILLAQRVIPESRAAGASRLDLSGAALITVALTAVVLPLVQGREQGWPAWTWATLGAAPALLGAFAAHQRWLSRRGHDPLLPPALFADRGFTVGLLAVLTFFAGMASFFLVLALYLQQGRGLTALEAGLVFAILGAAYMATSLRAPRLTLRLGRRLPVAGGLAIAAGHGLLVAAVAGIGTSGSLALLVPGLALVGAGMGLVLTPLTSTVMAGLAAERAGAASGALSTMQQVGNALGVAVTGVIFFGAVGDGQAHAFQISVEQLGVLGLVVAALAWLLPAPARGARSGSPA
jgi:EmrB/QacA subfamily drug resistance transporter